MNKLPLLLSIALTLVFLTACGNETQEKSDGSEFKPDENERLENEIKRLHDDELMPKMKDIQLMMKELENRMNDEESGYSEGYKKELVAAHEGLEESYDEMMQWMSNYSPKGKEGTEYKLYLVEQRGELWKMKEGFQENISYAQSTLDNEKYE
jgi:hypothetical protein